VTKDIAVSLDERFAMTLAQVAASKGLTLEQAATQMIGFACRLLEDSPTQTGVDLASELDFARGFRGQVLRRADQLLSVGEKLLLDSQGLQLALRNRAISEGHSP
jgi:hypothetical protein